MSQLFISHVEEDQDVAVEIGVTLEQRGFGVWYYERNSVPGVDYLDQMVEAIEQCQALILIISQQALNSRPINAEVIRGFEANKPFLPILHGVSRGVFHSRRPGWRMALGAATSIEIPSAGLAAIMDKIEAGVKKLGITPTLTNSVQFDEPPAIPSEDTVECTLFAPEGISGGTSLIHAWLHSASQAQDVMRMSTEFDARARRRAWRAIDRDLPIGARVWLELKAGNLRVKSLSNSLTWQGQPEAVVFRIEQPQATLPSMQVGRITVYGEDRIPLALLKFKMDFAGATESSVAKHGTQFPNVSHGVTTFRKVYLCYAHEDRNEVLRRAQMLRYTGIDFFMDTMSLTPGERWETEICRMIDESDAFMLFWSNAARRSDTVTREWRYALKLNRPEFIRPVIIEFPPPQIPPELAHIHFDSSVAFFALSGPEQKDSGL